MRDQFMILFRKRLQLSIYVVIISVLSVVPVSCIFNPDNGDDDNHQVDGKLQTPTQPGIVVENLKVAFQQLEPDWYEQCLHPNYFYESPPVLDEDPWKVPRSEEVAIITRMMEDCKQFHFTANHLSSYPEYGIDIEDKPDGVAVSQEHPDEIWYVYNYNITMEVYTNSHGDFRIPQNVQFKMVKDPDTELYSIIRWYDLTPD